MTLTVEQKQYVADQLLGTCNTGFGLADKYDVEFEDIEEAALDMGLDRCTVCDWWFEAHELDDDFCCSDCR